MPFNRNKSFDYKSLTASARNRGKDSDSQTSLKPFKNSLPQSAHDEPNLPPQSLTNPLKKKRPEPIPSDSFSELSPETGETNPTEFFSAVDGNREATLENLPYAEQVKRRKEQKRAEKDYKLLNSERWLVRHGHTFSYIGLYLFSFMVFFRPYELIPGLGFLSATAFYFALATLLIYIPTQLTTEGNLTFLSTEVKAILALTFLSLLTMPIAKSPGLAWETFNDPFIKAVLMFIVMVNVIRNRRRLMGMIWLSLSIGIVLSYFALDMYLKGEAKLEGYRVEGKIQGMFENPNEMAIHLVMMLPLAITLGLASRNKIMKIIYFSAALILLSATFVTYSRGGFLGLMASLGVMAWKLGRKSRLKVSLASIAAGILMLILAPGNFGIRVLSIFIPGLDEAGSADQRRELLERSILVSLRNPWGIGIGNFPIVGIQNLQTHNVYTQVSSELGILGLFAYLIFLISPFRKLGAIERTLFAKKEFDWFYYLAIGLQASIIAYMVSAFFASVAYNWFAYYLIAYAVAFRRIYQIEKGLKGDVQAKSFSEIIGWQTAQKNA